MLELGYDPLAYMFALLIIHRLIPRQCRQYRYPTPFRTLIQRDKEFRQCGLIDDEEG